MHVIKLIVEIITMVATVLPKVVGFIEELLKLKQDNITDAIAGGATPDEIDQFKENTRELIIAKTKAEFHGSGSVVPEPIIRILYEWIVLRLYSDTQGYADRIMSAIRKGFIGEPLSAREQIDQIKRTYPELFGERR